MYKQGYSELQQPEFEDSRNHLPPAPAAQGSSSPAMENRPETESRSEIESGSETESRSDIDEDTIMQSPAAPPMTEYVPDPTFEPFVNHFPPNRRVNPLVTQWLRNWFILADIFADDLAIKKFLSTITITGFHLRVFNERGIRQYFVIKNMLCGGTSPAGQMGPLFDAEVIGRLIGDVLEARRRAMACRNQDWDEMHKDTRRMLGMTSEELLEELFGEVENEISDSENEGQSKIWHKHGDELWEGQQLQRLGDLWAPEHSFDSMRPTTETGSGEPTSFRGLTFPLALPPDRRLPHPTRIGESNKNGKGKGKGKETDEGKGKGRETEDSDSDSFEIAYERQQEFRKRRLRKFRDLFRDVQAGFRQSHDETAAIIQGSSNGGTVVESSSSASARAVIEEDIDEPDPTDEEIEYREEFYMRFFGSHAFLEEESDADDNDDDDDEDEEDEEDEEYNEDEDNEDEGDNEGEEGNEGEEDNEDDADEYEDEELYVDYGELITYPGY